MSKSADAFRTISEVADELAVPKHVLRFWEARFPQIRPMKRGGGRRYYRPEDMALLTGIRQLLHAEGYTIKGVQKILRERGVEEVKRLGGVIDGPQSAASGASAAEAGGAGAAPIAATGRRRRMAGLGATAEKPEAVAPPSLGSVLARAIAELESCRRLLRDEAAGEAHRALPSVVLPSEAAQPTPAKSASQRRAKAAPR